MLGFGLFEKRVHLNSSTLVTSVYFRYTARDNTNFIGSDDRKYLTRLTEDDVIETVELILSKLEYWRKIMFDWIQLKVTESIRSWKQRNFDRTFRQIASRRNVRKWPEVPKIRTCIFSFAPLGFIVHIFGIPTRGYKVDKPK